MIEITGVISSTVLRCRSRCTASGTHI